MLNRGRYDFGGGQRLQGAFRGWAYQDFTAGTITTTSVTISANENGTDSYGFETGRIISGSAIIVLADTPAKKAYTGTTRLFSTKVAVTAHTGTAVTISGVPHSDWGDIRVYYFYDFPLGVPRDYQIPSKAVAENLFAELQSLMITEEELGDGSKDVVFNSIENTPIGASTPSTGDFTDGTFNKVLVGDGTEGAPSIAFSGDSSKGIWSTVDKDEITFSVGGTRVFRVEDGSIAIKDADSTYLARLKFTGTALTALRNLNIDLNNANRTIDLLTDITLDQDVSSSGSPTFDDLTLSGDLSLSGILNNVEITGGTAPPSIPYITLRYGSTFLTITGNVTLETTTDVTLDQDLQKLATNVHFAELNQSADKIRIRDDADSEPAGEEDGYISVYENGSTRRLYTFIGGNRYYVDLTADIAIEAGNSFGPWLFWFTYAA